MIKAQDVTQELAQRLDELGINLKEDDSWFYTEALEEGFLVGLTIEPKYDERYIISYGDMYHEHFQTISKAIDFFLAL
jgi:hypothetical protein